MGRGYGHGDPQGAVAGIVVVGQVGIRARARARGDVARRVAGEFGGVVKAKVIEIKAAALGLDQEGGRYPDFAIIAVGIADLQLVMGVVAFGHLGHHAGLPGVSVHVHKTDVGGVGGAIAAASGPDIGFHQVIIHVDG